MPRVSDAHLAARRAQILAAAARCFARNGFHATSMQDVINEAGLSVGAVYRYFRSKEELRSAVAEQTTGGILTELAEVTSHDPPLPLADAMARVVELLEPRLTGPEPVGRLVIQAWSEALRDPDLGEFASARIQAIRAHFVEIARRAQQAGDLPTGADPQAVGAVLMSLVPGYVVQRTLTGDPDAATFTAGLRTLFTPLPSPADDPCRQS